MSSTANQTIPYTLSDYFSVIRRRWIYVATILPGSILLAIYLAYTLPPLYESTGTILLEPSSIPDDLVRTTVNTYASEQLDLVWREVFTASNLEGLVEELEPYPDKPDLSVREKARLIASSTSTQRVDPITMEPTLESTAFSVSYQNSDPGRAQAVTERLLQMFLDYNRESRAESANETHDFLDTQTQEAKARVEELESQLADFHAKYSEVLPETRARSQQAIDRLESELDSLNIQIVGAEQRKRGLEIQLSQINPTLFDSSGDWRQELQETQAQLAAAKLRYSPDHPTRRQLERRVQELQAQAAAADNQPVVPDNPEYISVQSDLDAVKSELALLNANAEQDRSDIQKYEDSMKIAPEVERENNRLTRALQVAETQFSNLQSGLNTASLARVLETQEKGNRYSIHRRASYPSSPASPNRLGIILLGFVLGSAVSVGLAALMESADPSVRSARDLREITEIQPIGAVPVILNGRDRRNRAVAWGFASVIAIAAIYIVGSAVA